MVRIAHCTDFSENAKKALDTILFNFWSFDISIDILHLVEDNYEEAEENLLSYKKELSISLRNSVTLNTYLYRKEQKTDILEKLNTEPYFTTVVGLEGNGKSAGMGSFLKELYQSYLGTMTIIPFLHEIKIENRCLTAVEFDNLEALYNLVKISDFMSFQFTKLSVLIRAKEALSEDKLKEVTLLIEKVSPSIHIELLVCNHQDSAKSILGLVAQKKLDYCFLMKGDFFDNLVYDLINNKKQENTFRESLIRINTTSDEILKIKQDENSVQRLSLKSE